MALIALHALARQITWPQLTQALATTPLTDVVLAIALTAVSFAALGLYDVLAVHTAAPGRLPDRVAMLVGATGYAVSNTLGFAMLTGGTVRAKVYGANGLAAEDVARIIAATWITFWMGIAVAGGTILLLDPLGPAARLGLGAVADRAVGLSLLTAVAGFYVWIATGSRSVTVRGRTLALPTLRITLAQTATALIDIAATASVLWVLLPSTVEIGPAAFFVAYVAAMLVGIASHAPGGLGAFEATIIATLGLNGQADVVAALILFRLIYFVLPFLVAAVTIAVVSARGGRRPLGGRTAAMAETVAALVPPAMAGICILAGILLLVSGALPLPPEDDERLRAVAPRAVSEVSHLLGSILGVALVLLARSLLLRHARAWRFAMACLALGIIASLLKGLDWQEAAILAAMAGTLAASRRSFDRPGSAVRATPEWLVWTGFLIGASVWLGLIAHPDVALDRAIEIAPSAGGGARFLRASLMAVLALAIAVPLSWRRRDAALVTD